MKGRSIVAVVVVVVVVIVVVVVAVVVAAAAVVVVAVVAVVVMESYVFSCSAAWSTSRHPPLVENRVGRLGWEPPIGQTMGPRALSSVGWVP